MSSPLICVLGCILIAVVWTIIVFATDSSFGQRCARAFPDSTLAQERCVYRLSHGGRI